VNKPDALFGNFLLAQFGGATGELTAALQYRVQSFHVANSGIRDMLQDIAIEVFSHLEMVGKLIAQHTSKIDQTAVHDAPLFTLKVAAPIFSIVMEAAGRLPISKRVEMLFAICVPIFQLKLGHARFTRL
jgi:Mn-containing catalase